VDVRRGRIDAELDAERPAELQLRVEPPVGKDVDRALGQVLGRHGATLATVLALFRRKTRAPKRRRIRKLRLLALLVILGLLGLASFTFGFVAAVASELPDDPLKGAKSAREANTYIYAHDGKTVLAILRGDQARILVRSDEISPRMKHAIVAVEDRRFYEHRGVDLRGIGRAVWADIRHQGVVEGGSTITQQFVKNSVNDNDRTISRKLREAALAWQLEQRWKKERILTAYLNTVYFGNGAYGVEQASRIYFGHPAREMTWGEAALLAGIPKDPTLYDPVAHPGQARARRAMVLRALEANLDIRREERIAALAEPLPDPSRVTLPSTQGQVAPYFANYVKDQLVHRFGVRGVFGGGLRVKTTLDVGLQFLARRAIAEALPEDVGPDAALVALNPRTGSVVAMVGGRNYHESQYNLATQYQRQPGSAFKPFVLATALRFGIATSTTFDSRPVTIETSGRQWEVENYKGEYFGRSDIESATTHSDNSVYAQLSSLLGPHRVRQTAWDLGVDPASRDSRGRTKHRLKAYFSIALGGEGASPLELARAYAAFANGGFRMDSEIQGNAPRTIDCLLAGRGGCENQNRVVRRRVLTDAQAGIVTQLLQNVVRFGTGRAAEIPGRAVAGKTGTTEEYGDAWFVGYTPELVTAVWVGYPEKLQPMETEFHGEPVAGGTFPALIWKAFTEKALDYLKAPPEEFAAPPSLSASPVYVTFRHNRLERDNGVCTDAFQLAFYSGQEPKPVADCASNEVDVPDTRGNTLADAKARLAAQPLESTVVYKPAAPGQRLGVVVGQIPAGGKLSAGSKVMLVLPKAQHGVVPRLVGLPVSTARDRLDELDVDVEVQGAGGRIAVQWPKPGVAAAPGMNVVLRVKSARAG